MAWKEKAKHLRKDLQNPESAPLLDGAETWDCLAGELCETFWQANGSIRETAFLAVKMMGELALEFGRKDLASDLPSEDDIDAYLVHGKKMLESLEIKASDGSLRSLVIADFGVLNFSRILAEAIKGEAGNNPVGLTEVFYQGENGEDSFFASDLAISLGLVKENNLKSLRFDGIPFDIVFEAEAEEKVRKVCEWLVKDLRRLCEHADLFGDSERWVKEFSKLKAIYVSTSVGGGYAFRVKDVDSGGAIFLGLAALVNEKIASAQILMIHELDHLGYFRENLASGLKMSSTVLFELMAIRASLEEVRQMIGMEETKEYLEGIERPYLSILSGELGGVVPCDEWKVVRRFFENVNDPEIWKRVIEALDRVLV